MSITITNHNELPRKYSYSYKTPPVHTGYAGIAKKTAENVSVSLACLVIGPLGCAAGAASSCVGAVAGVVTCCAGAVSCAVAGILGLLAAPVIAVKDVASHTYEIL